MAHPDNEPDSEFADRIEDLDELIEKFSKWKNLKLKIPKNFRQNQKTISCRIKIVAICISELHKAKKETSESMFVITIFQQKNGVLLVGVGKKVLIEYYIEK